MITPIVGNIYVIHHSSGNVRAKFLFLDKHEGWKGQYHSTPASKRYVFLNLQSNREIVLKSRVKILRLEAE